ncbi:hypothetical protein PM082_023522 [Marasmius tenuissimus]|nr:hypothetical protein PM082_023522 [Marasmius tenuissimus]
MPTSSSRTQAQSAHTRGSASCALTTPPPLSPIVPPVRRNPCEKAAEKKRKDCEAALKDTRKAKKPQTKRMQQPKEKSTKEKLEEAAKYFKRCIDPCLPLYVVVIEGMRLENQDDDEWVVFIKELPSTPASPPPQLEQDPQAANRNQEGEDWPINQDQEPTEPSSDEQEVVETPEDLLGDALEAWGKLNAKTPIFLTFAEFCAQHQEPKDFADMAFAMTATANQVLYDNNHELKKSIEKLVSPNIFTQTSCVQDFREGSKAERGIENDVLLELQLH